MARYLHPEEDDEREPQAAAEEPYEKGPARRRKGQHRHDLDHPIPFRPWGRVCCGRQVSSKDTQRAYQQQVGTCLVRGEGPGP